MTGGERRPMDRRAQARTTQAYEGPIKELLSERFGIDRIDADTDLFDMGLDSMARLELLALLEERFSIELTEDITTEFQTLSRIARVVRSAAGTGDADRD